MNRFDLFLGEPPVDRRGIHKHEHPKSLPEAKIQLVIDHIKSFNSRLSHYSLHSTHRIYLPEELNITKMYELFMEQNSEIKCSFSVGTSYCSQFRHYALFLCLKFSYKFIDDIAVSRRIDFFFDDLLSTSNG